MEGEGEGMVAIVQGLRDAGLAVTLMGGRRHPKKRPSIAGVKQLGQLTQAKSSVETSTNGLPLFPSVDTAAQICDDRYTSSYQLAHCRARPSSPPVESAEFPPQRAEPCRTLGNFEIGGVGSGEAHPPLQGSRSPHSFRDSFTCVDRGLLSPSKASRCTEAFVHSLRKYPSLSPNRSISSDLVQRLITYTQTKNFSKSSHHSRSMRCLRQKNSESCKSSSSKTKLCKSVQTYIRGKKGKENLPAAVDSERDKEGRSAEIDKDARKSPKKYRSRSPPNEARSLRHNSSLINATYDYLKASRRSQRASDVRYLTDVTRCLRDTLRQICDDTPLAVFQMCPNMQNRYSQHRREHHRRGSGVESSSDTNNVEAQASLPMVSTGVPVMSSCDAISGTYQQTCPSRPKFCCYCRKPLPCACKSSKTQIQRFPFSRESLDSKMSASDDFPQKVEEAVMSWLQEIPVYANDRNEDRAKREDMARTLIEKLKTLRNDDDFEEIANAEIAKCVNDMPMWCPGNKNDQDSFKEQIVGNLTGKVLDLTKEKDKFKDEISKWVENLNLKRTDSQGQVLDKQSIVDNLVNRLKPLALNPPSDLKKAFKEEIIEVLDDLPIKIDGDKGSFLNKLADNLANQLQKIPAKDISKRVSVDLKDEFQKQIWEWLQDIPEFSSSTGSILENQKLVESLAKKLQKIQARGIDSSDTQEQMQNTINEWLEDNASKKGRLDSKTKNKLVEKLLGRLVNASKEASKRKSGKSVASDESMVLEILDWLKDIPELAGGSKAENRKMVEGLAKKLLELRSQGKDDSELEDEILNWLTTSFEDKGEHLDVRNQSNLVSKLLNKLKKLPVVKDEGSLVQDILNCLEDIPDLDMSSIGNKKLVEQLAKKIKDFQSQSQGDVDQEEMKDEIMNWLTDVANKSGAKLSPPAKNQLVNKLMQIAAGIPKQRRRWSKQENPQKIMNSLREEVGNILDKSNVQIDNRDNLESKLTDILADQVMRGEDDEKTKNRIINALEDSDIPQQNSEDIASRLTEMAKEMSLMYKTQDSTLFSDRKTFELSPMQKEMFQESAQREILDFIDEISGDTSAASKKKFKAAAQELAEKVGDIMSDRDTTSEDKKESIENEITKYFEELSIQTDVPIEEQASQLADRLQNLAFKTSTPKRSSLDKEISFRPHRDSRGRTMSAIDDMSQMMQTQALSKEEQQYMGQLTGIINDWMSNLPIDLDSDEGKGFKDVMIKDLAGDIIDRQKYLQLNPEAKTSDEEELEHLKYQVFRWLNKLPDVKNLMPSISKTDDLMDRIKAVAVPQLIKAPERRLSKATKDSSVQHLSKDLASLQNEILKWFEAIHPKYVSSKDKKRQREMVKDLAEQIDQFRKDGTLTEPVFQEVVSDWLEKALKDANEKYISSITEGLKSVLVNKDLMSLNPQAQVRKISICPDGIREAILKWSQNLPFLPGKSLEHAKKDVEHFSTKLKALTNVHPNNLDDIQHNLEKEIKGFLHKLPVHKHKVNDDHVKELCKEISELVKSATEKLLSMPTKMTMESVSSKSGFKKAADVLYDNIEDWCESLPIQEGNTPEEKEKVKTLRHNIASKLINIIGDLNMNPEIFNDDLLYEDVLNDEIDNLLSTLPPSPELENNLPALKENLIEKVKEAKQKTQDELAGQAYKQQLRDAISKTLPSIENLSAEEQAPFEVLKDELADAYIELHYAADNDEIKAKLKNKISNEINQFCNDYLKRYPSSPVDPRKLNRELYNVLQKVPIPKDETIKNQVEQVRIKEEINEWLKELPLKEDETPSEQLQRNKIVTLLAKRLHDIEKEKEFNPEIDVEERMQKEIKKWIKKLPIKPGEENNVEQMVEQLTNKLKNSEESRRFSISHIRRSADYIDEERDRICGSICPFYSKMDTPKPPSAPCRKFLSQYAPPFPPSTLSTEDRAHLQRIRERNEQREPSVKPSYSPCCCKDASVSPIPIDAGSQTDVGQQWQAGSARSLQRQSFPCPPMSPPDCPPCSQTANKPVSPHIIVKEYYWDSPESKDPCIPCISSEEQGYPGQMQPRDSPPYQNWPQSQLDLQSGTYEGSTRQGPPMGRSPQSCMTSPRPPCTGPPPPCMQPSPLCMQPPPNRMQPPQLPSSCMQPSSPPQSNMQPPSPPCMQAAPPPCTQPSQPYMEPPCTQLPPQFSPCVSQPKSPQQSYTPQSYTHNSSMPPCLSRQSAQQSMTSQRSPCQIPQPRPPCTQKPPCVPPRPCMPDPPCTAPPSPPCMSSRQSVQKPQCMPRPAPCIPDPSESYTLPKPPCSPRSGQTQRRRDRPCFGSPDISSTSSPFETECPEAGGSRSFGPRVTRLGSLDDVPCSKTCGSQSPRAKRSRGSPNEDFDWTIRFPEDTDFWGSPCPRRRPHRSPQRDGSFVKEKERKEEKLRCRCRERVLTKCVSRRPQGCCDDDAMKHCSKCCGVHCPHPSYLFFG